MPSPEGYMREPPLDRKLNWNVIIREDFDHLIDALAMQDEGGFQGKLVIVNEQ